MWIALEINDWRWERYFGNPFARLFRRKLFRRGPAKFFPEKTGHEGKAFKAAFAPDTTLYNGMMFRRVDRIDD